MRSSTWSMRCLVAGIGSLCLAAVCATDARAQVDSVEVIDVIHVEDSGLATRTFTTYPPSADYLLWRRDVLAELREARARWARRRPAAYVFRVARGWTGSGFEGRVAVHGDSVRVLEADGADGSAPPTVEDLFAALEHAIRADDLRVGDVRFHPRLGFPLGWTTEPAMPISIGRGWIAVHDFRGVR